MNPHPHKNLHKDKELMDLFSKIVLSSGSSYMLLNEKEKIE